MAGMSDERAIQELLPGYALGSLEPEESALVSEHLVRCRQCRKLLASYREVTGSLALVVADHDPPASLEARILEKIAAGPTVRRFQGAPRFRHPIAAAVAAVLIVALAATNIFLLTAPLRSNRPGVPGLVTVALAGTSAARGAYGTIVIDRDDNRGVMAVRGLAPLDPGRRYQLWILRGNERRSGGLFSVTDDGYGSLQIAVPEDFTGFTGFGISIEPSGGSPSPTGERVMTGRI